jgi:hypothetical protein
MSDRRQDDPDRHMAPPAPLPAMDDILNNVADYYPGSADIIRSHLAALSRERSDLTRERDALRAERFRAGTVPDSEFVPGKPCYICGAPLTAFATCEGNPDHTTGVTPALLLSAIMKLRAEFNEARAAAIANSILLEQARTGQLEFVCGHSESRYEGKVFASCCVCRAIRQAEKEDAAEAKGRAAGWVEALEWVESLEDDPRAMDKIDAELTRRRALLTEKQNDA